MKMHPMCRPRTHLHLPEKHRPEGEPQWTSERDAIIADTSFSGEVKVIPRSDFQTVFPKELCLERYQG